MSGPSATAIAPAPITSPNAFGRPSAGTLAATSATTAGKIIAAPMPSRKDKPKISIGRLGASAVVREPRPETKQPNMKAGFPPHIEPSLAPVTMNIAITSVYKVIAVWIPVTVVPTSLATVAIATFMTELSSVMRNCADASGSRTTPAALVVAFALVIGAPLQVTVPDE